MRGNARITPGAVPSANQPPIYTQQPDGTLTRLAAGRPVTVKVPADVLHLANWKLTLPTGPAHNATTVQQPALDTLTNTNFRVTAAGDGVQFRAACTGSTTSGSKYPRCELREMDGAEEASWSCAKGSSHLSVDESVDVLPPTKRQVVCAQIHNASDDVVEILGDGLNSTLGKDHTALTVRFRGETQKTHLTDTYVLGTRFRLDIGVAAGKITISYNGVAKLVLKATDKGAYYKVGAYTQSNPSHGDTGTTYGQVTVYAVTATHAS